MQDILKLPVISNFGLACTSLFILLSFIGRFLFPWGDEPDFWVRAPQIIYGYFSLPKWTPYYIFSSVLDNIELYSCRIDSSPFSLWAYINPITCIENLNSILARLTIEFIVIFPLFAIIIFRRFFARYLTLLRIQISPEEWNRRLDAVSLSLLFPSMIYYLGLLSTEQMTLVISIFIVIFIESIIFSAFLVYLVFLLDIGNSAILIFFLIVIYFLRYFSQIWGLRKSLLISLIFLFPVYFFNIGILEIIFDRGLVNIPFYQTEGINTLSTIINSGLIDKYPIILRPVISYMTFVFYTPADVKSILLYILVGILIVYFAHNLKIRYQYLLSCINRFPDASKELSILEKYLIYVASSITMILFFVFILPTYANAKYYIFTLPIFFQLVLNIFPRQNFFWAINILTFILFINLYLMMAP